MSTPSPQPLDYDLVSPYAPKHAREQTSLRPGFDRRRPADDAQAKAGCDRIRARCENPGRDRGQPARDDRSPARPSGAAAGCSRSRRLRPRRPMSELPAETAPDLAAEMSQIESDDRPDAMPSRTIDALDAPGLAEDRLSPEHRYYEAMRVQQVLQQVAQQVAHHSAREPIHAAPAPEPEPLCRRNSALPPAFLAPSMEPIQFDEPWPKTRPRRRNSSATLLLRFGFAASGAAAVALFALPDVRPRLIDAISEPLAGLTSNAAAVFGEGKPVLARDETIAVRTEPIAPVAVRTEPIVVAKEPDRLGAPMPKLATAGLAPALPDPRNAARNDNSPPARTPEAQPQRETVMVPSAPSRAAGNTEPRAVVIWHGPPGRAAANESATSGVATRPLCGGRDRIAAQAGQRFHRGRRFRRRTRRARTRRRCRRCHIGACAGGDLRSGGAGASQGQGSRAGQCQGGSLVRARPRSRFAGGTASPERARARKLSVVSGQRLDRGDDERAMRCVGGSSLRRCDAMR